MSRPLHGPMVSSPVAGGAALGPGVAGPYAGLTLLTSFPTDINNAYWTKVSTTITTGRPDNEGGSNAEAMFETAVNDNTKHVLADGITTLVAGTTYIQEGIVKSIGGRWLLMRGFAGGYASGTYGWFDVTNGVVGTTGPYGTDMQQLSLSIEPAGGGYFRCRLSFLALTSAAFDESYWNSQTGDGTDVAFLGDITKGLDFASLGVYRVG